MAMIARVRAKFTNGHIVPLERLDIGVCQTACDTINTLRTDSNRKAEL